MKNKLIVTDELADEVKACFVEAEFNSRWELIRGYHMAGEMMQGLPRESLQDLAKKINRSERMLYYAVKFYELYPKLDKLPEGKNVSMNKIITKYLTEPSEKVEVPRLEIIKHSGCGKYQISYYEESICNCDGKFPFDK